jgi:hypothetical protein
MVTIPSETATQSPHRKARRVIPTANDLASSPLTHRPADLFNPPSLTNFLGCVQAAIDPIALWNLNFPPLACGDVASGQLFLDGRLFQSSGEPVTFTWFPDRIERRATWRGLEVSSTTVLAWGQTAALVVFGIRNTTATQRRVRGGIALRGSVARSVDGWRRPSAPSEGPNRVEVDPARRAVIFRAPSGAASVQGLVASTGTPDERGVWIDVDLPGGETFQAAYVHAVGDDTTRALALFDQLATDVHGHVVQAHTQWDAELAAVFTPDNDRYSGSLPVLESSDADLLRLYHMGVLGVVFLKRDTPHSVVGRSYDTLMPRYWQTTTFLWDYALSSTVHALLDPQVMRGHLERWMTHDIHTCYGTDWLTGQRFGMWYSVNDHAMCQMIDEYLRWSGATNWLDAKITSTGPDPTTVGTLLRSYATSWRSFESASGLADYGGVGNLLECVSSYVHEVAALNAANVWNLRTAAHYQQHTDPAGAARLRADAEGLLAKLWALYAEGEGWFHARQPDGQLLPVRHCYDLLTVLGLIPQDISDSRRDEMVHYFRTQLQTPTWLRALSPEDPDAVSSLRPDHQWNGAYTAWPALVAAGLFGIGRDDVAAGWLRGLASSANQGPFAQAHFVEDFVPTDSGGAAKSSSEEPYICDWACSSGGAWVRLVIKSVFGIQPNPDGLTATPRLDRLDPDARLVNLRHHGRLWTVDRTGATPA